MTLNIDPRGFYERYKAIIVGFIYALIVLVLISCMTSCKTREIITTKYEIDSLAVESYNAKIDSLNEVINKSVSKEFYKRQIDSLMSVKINEELIAQKDGTIVNYNNDGSIKSKEEYHINLNGKKDTEKEIKLKVEEEYKNEIETLTDSISLLSKTIIRQDSIITHIEKENVSEPKESKLQKFVNRTWLALSLWFFVTLIFLIYYVRKRFWTKKW